MINVKIKTHIPQTIPLRVEYDQDGGLINPVIYGETGTRDYIDLEKIPVEAPVMIIIQSPKTYRREIDLQWTLRFTNIYGFLFEGYDSNIDLLGKNLKKIYYFTYKASKHRNCNFLLDCNNLIRAMIIMPKENMMARIGPRLRDLYLFETDCRNVSFKYLLNIITIHFSYHNKGLTGDALMPLKNLVDIYIEYNRTIDNLNFLAHQTHLISIQFFYCSRIEAFPDMSKCEQLKYIKIETCTRLRNFEGLKNAPNLSHIVILENKGLKFEQIACLSELKKLERILVCMSSQKEEEKCKKLFGDKWMPVMNETWEYEVNLDQYPLE